MLKKYDKNGDGKLSDAEREVMRKERFAEKLRGGRGGPFGFRMQFPPDIVTKYDKDGDGELNDEETQAALEGMRKQWEEITKQYDKNGNGRLDEAELEAVRADIDRGKIQGLPRGFGQGGPRGGAGPRGGGGPWGGGRFQRVNQRDEIIRQADKDGDGKLNEEELRAARETLAKLRTAEPSKP